MRPTFVHLVVGFVLGTAVVASLTLPGQVVIAKQPAMQRLVLPHPPAPVVVEAAPLPRVPVRRPPPPQAQPTTFAHSPVAHISSVTRPRPRPRRPAHRVLPSRPGPSHDQSLSPLDVSPSEPVRTKDKKPKKPKAEKAPKASARPEGTKKPKKPRAEKKPKAEKRPKSKGPGGGPKPEGKHDKESRGGKPTD